MELRKIITYRADFWVNFIGQTIFSIIISYYLWQAIFASQGATSMNGFSLDKIIFYYLMVPIISRIQQGEMIGSISREIYDGAYPSGNSVAAINLIKLYLITGNHNYKKIFDDLIKADGGLISKQPTAFIHLLSSLNFDLDFSSKLIVVENKIDGSKELLKTLNKLYLPFNIVVVKKYGEEGEELEKLLPYLKEYKNNKKGKFVAWICKGKTCFPPESNVEVILKQLGI
jgi:uncharacterized protein YyaL (SSP411 family)